MVKAIYPGSFDPITLGHMDIIRRIHPLFSEFTVVVANSTAKKYLFSLEKRMQLIQENLSDLKGVRIDVCEGLIVDYAKQAGSRVIVRGLRALSDFEHEIAMANINKRLNPEIETMIVFTDPAYSFIASRMVKEVATHGADLSGFVPANVAAALKKEYS